MFNPLQNFNNLNKNSSGIDQYGEYIEQTYGDPEFDQKRDDFLQNVSQQEQQTFGGGMKSFAPSTNPQLAIERPMFQLHTSGPVIGSPFGGSANQPRSSGLSNPYESYFPTFTVPTFFQEGGSVSGPPPTHGPDANGVSNRRMFRSRDSRKKLAQMGGILSSSPELQETAMTFANGGGADLPDYIINVPGLTDVGEYLRISSATLEKLNNAVPEIMANARMVSPVDMVISEGFSSLVANARPGDAVVGTRVNRLREQRAASDSSRVPVPPETAQISSAAFAASNAANAARDNRVARSIAAASNEDLTREMSGDPYAGDIFSDDRIRVRPRENVGGGIEAQDAANFEKEKISAALIESLAPNNAQGQPGGILGARYPESDMPLTMLNTQRAIESLVKGTPYSGELSPSQTARNQETLSNTLRREEIAQQRADIAEAGRIAQDAADTREAFSVPLEEPASDPYAGDIFSDDRVRFRPRENIGGGIEAQDAANFALESGIAKAVVPKSVLSSEQNAVLNAIDEFSLPSSTKQVVPKKVEEYPISPVEIRRRLRQMRDGTADADEIFKSPAEELIGVSGPLPQAFTGAETENRAADAANAIAVLTGTAKPKDGESSVLSSAGEAIKRLLPDEFGFQRRQRERRELAEDKRFDQTGPAAKPSTDELLEVASSILSDEQKEAIASGKISDRAKALLPEQELFSEAPVAGTGQAGLAQKIRDGSLSPEELKAALDSGAGDLTLEAAERIDPEITGAVSFDPKIVPSALLGEEGKARRLKNIQDRLDKQTLDTFTEIQRLLPAKSGTAADEDQKLAEEQVVDTEATLLEEIKRTSGPIDDPETKIPQVPKVPETVVEKITTLGEKSGLGKKFGGDGSIADLTKDYTKLLKSLLGESDEDKAARKGELFMLMGAALMSGKSSNALTNIGNALQIGAKAAIQDRTTRKKRDDTIGLKGLELAVAEEGRREAARVRKEDREQRLDDSKDLALYKAGLKPAKEFLETPTGKLMKEVYVKILSDGLAQSQQLDVVRENAFDALSTFSEDAQGAFKKAAMFAEQAVIGQSQAGSQDFLVEKVIEKGAG